MVLTIFLLPVVIFLVIQFASGEQLLVKDVKFSHIDFLDKNDVIVTEMEDPREIDENIYDNINNIIIFQNSSSVVLHSSKLNSASKGFGIPLEIFLGNNEIDSLEQTWYQFAKADYETQFTEFIPLTGCLNNEYGDGGTLGGTFSTSVGKVGTIDLAAGFSTTYIKETFDYSWAVGSTSQITGSYTCNIGANSTGQMFIRFSYLLLKDCKMRKISIKKTRALNSYMILSNKLRFSEWETPSEEIKLLDYNSSPSFLCVTDDDYLECDQETMGDSYQL